MAPVRIKIYGLFRVTKRTYLRIQAYGFVLLLGLIASGVSYGVTTGKWRPVLPPRNVSSYVIAMGWLAALTLLLEIVETIFVLRKFARAEEHQRAEETEATAPSVALLADQKIDAFQLPSGVTSAPVRENNPHP